jgi:hypothetical protein
MAITLHQSVEIDGKTWRIFDVNFKDDEGRLYGFYIYAISREHAACVLDDIKRTATLSDGDIIEIGDM